MIEKIKQELMQQKNLSESECVLAPASKYAYYNPAPKDKNGDIVVREAFPILQFLSTLSIAATLLGFIGKIAKEWQIVACGIAFFIAIIIYFFYLYQYESIAVNKTGITLEKQIFRWDDCTSAYLFFHGSKRTQYVEIVLVRADGTFTLLDVSRVAAAIRFSKVATALRDCQPKNY